MALNNPFAQYRQVQVGTANQAKLILLVYEGAIRFSQQAKEKIEAGDLESKGFYINKAYSAISELRKSLNFEAGKEIAASLERLYLFMGRQLIMANIKNEPKLIELVINLLVQLRDAWKQVVYSRQDDTHKKRENTLREHAHM